jgi:arylsulfatase A-like enzyme
MGGKNVVLLINDSLRRDHLGCYGNDWIQTPRIDELSRESMTFDRARVGGLPTVPARTEYLTGKHTLPFRKWTGLKEKDKLLAEFLHASGLTTCLITDTYHLHKPGFRFGSGFQEVLFVRGQEADPWEIDPSISVNAERHFKFDPKRPDDAKTNREVLTQHLKNRHWWRSDADCFAAQCVKTAIAWLDRQPKHKNWLLVLDLFDPHEPWDPMAPFDRMYADPSYKGKDIILPISGDVDYLEPAELQRIKDLYAGKVSQTDKWDGVFLDALRDRGLMDETLVMFTSDHGEPFGERGWIRKARYWPVPEETHIPLIVRHPEGHGAGKRFDDFTMPMDIMPTILDFLGMRVPRTLHGDSLLPIVKGEKDTHRDFAVCGYHPVSRSYYTKQWTYIEYPGFEGKQTVLFNVEEDPDERNDLVGKKPEVAKELSEKLVAFMGRLRA